MTYQPAVPSAEEEMVVSKCQTSACAKIPTITTWYQGQNAAVNKIHIPFSDICSILQWEKYDRGWNIHC